MESTEAIEATCQAHAKNFVKKARQLGFVDPYYAALAHGALMCLVNEDQHPFLQAAIQVKMMYVEQVDVPKLMPVDPANKPSKIAIVQNAMKIKQSPEPDALHQWSDDQIRHYRPDVQDYARFGVHLIMEYYKQERRYGTDSELAAQYVQEEIDMYRRMRPSDDREVFRQL